MGSGASLGMVDSFDEVIPSGAVLQAERGISGQTGHERREIPPLAEVRQRSG